MGRVQCVNACRKMSRHAFVASSVVPSLCHPLSFTVRLFPFLHRHRHRRRHRSRHRYLEPQHHHSHTSPIHCSGRAPRPYASDDEQAMHSLVRQVETFSPARIDDQANSIRTHIIQVLNAVSKLSLSVSITPVYDALLHRGRLRGYGSARRGPHRLIVEQGCTSADGNGSADLSFNAHVSALGGGTTTARPSLQEKARIARELPQRTGLPLRALTPEGRGRGRMDDDAAGNRMFNKLSSQGVQVVAVALLWATSYLLRQYAVTASRASSPGPLLALIEVVRPLVLGAGFTLTVDQIALRGLLFDSVYQRLNPGYRNRIVAHEAGHFLLAYLFGLPVHKYTLSAWDALRNQVPGQAATLFADDELAASLTQQRLGVSVVDRYAVVAMAGLAAEALLFGQATGGDADVNGLVSLLEGLQPAWRQPDIRIQARWAVVVAVGVLRTERAAYDGLCAAMQDGRALGECVMTVESLLSSDGDVRALWAREGLTDEVDRWAARERDMLADMKLMEEQGE